MNKLSMGLIGAFLPCVMQSATVEELTIMGSGMPTRVVRALGMAFNAAQNVHQVSVPPSSGVAGALLAIEHEGQALARFPRPLNAAETGRGLRQVVFARDTIVFVVEEAVHTRSVTTAELADIFSGKITDWQNSSGAPAPIQVLARPPQEASFTVIRNTIGTFRTLTLAPTAKIAASDPAMLDMLDRFPLSIGFMAGSNLRDSRSALARADA